MPEECIICLGEDDLIKVECKKCNGIYIHQDCFKTLIDRFGRKCPHCRGYLKEKMTLLILLKVILVLILMKQNTTIEYLMKDELE